MLHETMFLQHLINIYFECEAEVTEAIAGMRWAMGGDGRRAMGDGRWAMSDERWAMSDELLTRGRVDQHCNEINRRLI